MILQDSTLHEHRPNIQIGLLSNDLGSPIVETREAGDGRVDRARRGVLLGYTWNYPSDLLCVD